MSNTTKKGSPRNNLARYPAVARERVYFLLFDGCTGDEIRNDPIVLKCAKITGKILHGNTLTAAKRSEEYALFKQNGTILPPQMTQNSFLEKICNKLDSIDNKLNMINK